MILKAKQFALQAHESQKYGDYPYSKHLNDVYNILVSFGFDYEEIFVVAWLHDTIEDTHVTYEDIYEDFGKEIADLVYLVTDKRGKSRSERHQKTYPDIAESPVATAVKSADRLANMTNSQHEKEKMFFMYEKEYPYFKETLMKNLNDEYFAGVSRGVFLMFDLMDRIIERGPHME